MCTVSLDNILQRTMNRRERNKEACKKNRLKQAEKLSGLAESTDKLKKRRSMLLDKLGGPGFQPLLTNENDQYFMLNKISIAVADYVQNLQLGYSLCGRDNDTFSAFYAQIQQYFAIDCTTVVSKADGNQTGQKTGGIGYCSAIHEFVYDIGNASYCATKESFEPCIVPCSWVSSFTFSKCTMQNEFQYEIVSVLECVLTSQSVVKLQKAFPGLMDALADAQLLGKKVTWKQSTYFIFNGAFITFVDVQWNFKALRRELLVLLEGQYISRR